MLRFPLLSVLLVLAFQSTELLSQRDSSRNDFASAESWFLFEDYAEAEPIYQKLLQYYPDNDNIRYRIGICLLKDPYRKEESISYLLEASHNINPKHKEGSINEKAAPPDVLYYLGAAYHASEKLDLAIENYEAFLRIMDPAIYDDALVKEQIQACKNARRLMSMPVDIDLHLLSESVNTRYTENHPVVSGDGQRMVFITEQPFFDEALFVEKQGDDWTLPMSLTSMLGFDENVYPTGLNRDGTELLMYYDDEHVGNIYHSRLENGFWLPATKVEEPVSTKYWESHASFSADGQRIYFTSNRKEGYGGLDIYYADRLEDGNWGEPVNLGPAVNTRYNEETPFVTEDGKTLFFSSYGHFNMGGYDIFYSTLGGDGKWSEPVNMGYPINTTGDDLFFMPVNNGLGGFQSRVVNARERKSDIYYMDIYSANNPRIYVVTGYVRTRDGGTDLTTLRMSVIDPATGDTIQYDIPVEGSGRFSLELTRGDYRLHFSHEGYEDLITPLSITALSNKAGITMDEVLEMEPVVVEPLVFEGEESAIEVKDTVLVAEAGKELIIPVKGIAGAALVIRHLADSALADSDTLVLEKRRADIVIVPLQGENIIQLEMTDSEGNIHRQAIRVTGTAPIPTKRELRKQERELQKAGIPPSLAGSAAAVLLLDLRDEAESEQMQDYLDRMDLGGEGIETPAELFEKLYGEARAGNLDIQEVDRLLAREISGGDVNRLLAVMALNAEGPLKDYLEQLNLEEEGITSVEELLKHLEAAGAANGFTMDDVRRAMMKSLEPGEVDEPREKEEALTGFDKLYAELLARAEGDLKEILEGLNPPGQSGISNTEDLVRALVEALEERGYRMKEIRRMLEELLPGQGELIRKYTGKGMGTGAVLALVLGISAGLFLLLLFFRRRRESEKKNIN